MPIPETISRALLDYAETRPEIIAVYIFGSYAAGQENANSDIDVALLLKNDVPDLPHLMLRLDVEVCRALSSDRVDVLILNSTPLSLRAEVVRTGRLIASWDDAARIDFEVQTMNRWWDFKPLLDEMDQIFFQRLKEKFTDDQRRTYQATRKAFARAR
ncbi:MAG TPA: nucleotidyltransferase domain-containing protein [Chloroflexi bacterium]|nr:MAG: hypothetical protein B6243_11225 [Anaerolineaceae bacterium 4572_5.2]HEY83732.1 nucleotidyltransferase domain-containing protein [Chloroflexota bacterium]